jgi:hypothetical protein
MPWLVEGVVDRSMGSKEPLRGSLGFETQLLAIALADGQVAVFGPIIFAEAPRVVKVKKPQFTERSRV